MKGAVTMNKVVLTFMLILSLPVLLHGQENEKLIINPKLKGGLGALPFPPCKIVRVDTMPPGWRGDKKTSWKASDYVSPDDLPVSLLITGIVPDATKRYVVAVTKDEAEFQQAFREYMQLRGTDKCREAFAKLHVLRSISVSKKVERFWGHEKGEEIPEEAGSFFLELSIFAYRKHGGCLTFLSYDPKPGDDVVDLGYGLNDTIHGVLMIEDQAAEEGEKPEYTMRIIKAHCTDR